MAIAFSTDLCPREVRQLAAELAPQIAELPRLSCVVEQFLQHAGRDTATAAEIGAALTCDPLLRDWVLRQANSGFCKLNRPLATVAEACVVLGLGAVTRLVYAACTRDLLRRRLSCYQYPGNGFWLHGLAVGLAARRLAALLKDASPLAAEEAQIAGLLHDMGKLLLDDRLPRAGGPRRVLVCEERASTGLDHGVYSAAIAATWSLPLDIVLAMAFHHGEAPPPAARLIAVADHLITHWDVGTAVYPRLERDPPLDACAAIAEPLGVERTILARWSAELPPLLTGLAEMVRTLGRGSPPQFAGTRDEPGNHAPGSRAVASASRSRRPDKPSARRPPRGRRSRRA